MLRQPRLHFHLLMHHIINTTNPKHIDLQQPRRPFPWSLAITVTVLACVVGFLFWEIYL